MYEANRDNEDYPRHMTEMEEERERIAYEEYLAKVEDELI